MSTNIRDARRARRGSTLLEIVVSALILAMLVGAIGQAVMTGSAAYQQGMSSAQIEGQARRLLERIASEFADASRSTLAPASLKPLGASTVTFSRCSGWDAATDQIAVENPRRIQLVLETGELDNGLDDNGNGLVDERRVMLVSDMTKPAEDVCLGGYVREYAEGEIPGNLVDENGNGLTNERGLSFESDGAGTITIRLTIERVGTGGRLVDFTVQTAVRMRND